MRGFILLGIVALVWGCSRCADDPQAPPLRRTVVRAEAEPLPVERWRWGEPESAFATAVSRTIQRSDPPDTATTTCGVQASLRRVAVRKGQVQRAIPPDGGLRYCLWKGDLRQEVVQIRALYDRRGLVEVQVHYHQDAAARARAAVERRLGRPEIRTVRDATDLREKVVDMALWRTGTTLYRWEPATAGAVLIAQDAVRVGRYRPAAAARPVLPVDKEGLPRSEDVLDGL